MTDSNIYFDNDSYIYFGDDASKQKYYDNFSNVSGSFEFNNDGIFLDEHHYLRFKNFDKEKFEKNDNNIEYSIDFVIKLIKDVAYNTTNFLNIINNDYRESLNIYSSDGYIRFKQVLDIISNEHKINSLILDFKVSNTNISNVFEDKEVHITIDFKFTNNYLSIVTKENDVITQNLLYNIDIRSDSNTDFKFTTPLYPYPENYSYSSSENTNNTLYINAKINNKQAIITKPTKFYLKQFTMWKTTELSKEEKIENDTLDQSDDFRNKRIYHWSVNKLFPKKTEDKWVRYPTHYETPYLYAPIPPLPISYPEQIHFDILTIENPFFISINGNRFIITGSGSSLDINTRNYIKDAKINMYGGHLLLDEEGRIGIGTTTPSGSIHISGNNIDLKLYNKSKVQCDGKLIFNLEQKKYLHKWKNDFNG